ncbi:hypothetical protein MKX01_029052 [Papaver californicum]|nr:hypothetical protein MKX01_029052 [Papaver californicum]
MTTIMEATKISQGDDLWKNMELGLIPDEEVRRLMKIGIEKRIRWGTRSTQQEQFAQLIDFTKAPLIIYFVYVVVVVVDITLRGMKMATEIDTLDSKVYETPNSFQQIMSGTYLKESSGLFTDLTTTMDEASIKMMDLYCERADIKDGQTVLDLGCGPGPLVLYIAKKYKNCKITGVTNALSQKEYILEQSKKLNLSNVEIILADVTSLDMESKFDRVFVIGLIEHMKTFELFFRKISKWMKDDGLLFLEHFCHKSFSYDGELLSEDDWYGKNFFPLGSLLIPSATCLLYFQDDVAVVDHWILSGNHFARTNEEMLKGIDGKIEEIKDIFMSFYGINKQEALKLINWWRLFCITGAELFKYNNGEEWLISQLLFKKK